MRSFLALLLMALLVGCGQAAPPRPAVAPDPPPPAGPGPGQGPATPRFPTRDALRDQLEQALNESEGPALETVRRFAARHPLREDEVPWLEADLTGDGEPETVLALPVASEHFPDRSYASGALFVIYRKDGRYAVDRSDSMGERAELRLMGAHLHGAADLTGTGSPQIIWFRPHVIATGPQPFSVFVSAWEPGTIAHLPGAMSISNLTLRVDGKDLVLRGVSREEWFIRSDPVREDRYRYDNDAFRLVDRRFVKQSEYGYDRFWDGLVAEGAGRLADAEEDYRAAADPQRQAHPGSYRVYNAPPYQLTPAELERFGAALRAFARFRLGGLLLGAGRQEEALAALAPAGGPYDGLTEAMRRAADREDGCRNATAWAAGQPDFLAALNAGVGHSPWTPELLCTYMPLEEKPLNR